MKEVKLLAALVVGLLAAAWVSWTGGDESTPGEDKVTIVQAVPSEVRSLSLITRTQTVAMTFEDGDNAKTFAWFRVYSRSSTRAFAGSDKVDDLLKNFAPFEAIRSLGKGLAGEALESTGLDAPKRKLTVGYKSGERVYELGGRTHGSRDHYVRAAGGDEVFLVASRVLADLEFPEGKYMQRKLRKVELTDVASLTISAGGKLKKVLRGNRLSAKDAFWADEAKPDEKSETLENYIDKVEKLSINRYGTETEPLGVGEPVVEITWYDEGDKVLEHLVLSKVDGDKPKFIAKSNITFRPGEVSRSTAEQLERDLSVVFGE